ncbi:putative FAD-linked oxidoreductase [Xylophilus ampelinus]|nr:putative FAD-linked oxidoreductase [Xylophilus ampelinus]
MSMLGELKSVVGSAGWVEAAADLERYLVDIRGVHRGAAELVVKPATAQEVASIVRLCAREKVPLVPQGGNTGLCGGAVPDASGAAVVLSLERMRSIRGVDVANASITVEAGVVLAAACEAARQQGLLLPLSLGAEGSCQIGGTIATNAGGHHVRKYGSMRNLVLGLEVVLPDGAILDACRSLRKDNMGFDLKQLFVGSEGTLGVITAATLKLFPLPREKLTVLAAVGSLGDAVTCFNRLQARFASELAVCELMSDACVTLAVRNVPGVQQPFAARHPWMLLLEWESDHPMDERVEAALSELHDAGTVIDAVVGASLSDSQHLWHLREAIVEAERIEQGSVKHDIAIPIGDIPRFVAATERVLFAMLPGVRLQVFGHLGDGNLHFNLVRPEGMDRATFLQEVAPLTRHVHEEAIRGGGTVSAEHGIGKSKVDELERYRGGTELALMQRLKQFLDPVGVMNPGKVVRVS